MKKALKELKKKAAQGKDWKLSVFAVAKKYQVSTSELREDYQLYLDGKSAAL